MRASALSSAISKQRGLYDDSVVIVTADHGDSLGEDGRMGHAYTLYPEIVRIPLLVHLRPGCATRLMSRTKARCSRRTSARHCTRFSASGRRNRAPFFGRPLFRPRGQPPRGAGTAVYR